MKTWLADLGTNLRHGLRAVLLRPVALDDFRIGPDQLVALVALVIVAEWALAIGFNGPSGYFNFYALAVELTIVMALLLTALVAARLTGEPRLLLGYPVAVLAMDPYFLALHAVLRWGGGDAASLAPGAAWGVNAVLIAWFLAAACTLLLRFAPGRALRSLAGFAVYLLLFLGSYWWLPPQDLWLAREHPAAARQASVADEAAFHAQPALLEASLAALKPERPGVPDIYFVGFGAYSHEDVFMNEVHVIGELFRERFDAEGRTVALINNPQTAGDVPVASATNLARVLRHLGGIMNREEDMLVLYLTTHGTEKHRLSVVNWPLALQDIDPPMLRRMLDDAGIKWRVLAISACYAGGFIDPLKTETSLIMTAADARRQSFGCGAQSEFTYFGRALFDEELRTTHSFTEAFERARRAIAERERAGKHEPSNPQIYVGEAMAGKLRAVESHLLAVSVAASAAEADR